MAGRQHGKNRQGRLRRAREGCAPSPLGTTSRMSWAALDPSMSLGVPEYPRRSEPSKAGPTQGTWTSTSRKLVEDIATAMGKYRSGFRIGVPFRPDCLPDTEREPDPEHATQVPPLVEPPGPSPIEEPSTSPVPEVPPLDDPRREDDPGAAGSLSYTAQEGAKGLTWIFRARFPTFRGLHTWLLWPRAVKEGTSPCRSTVGNWCSGSRWLTRSRE
jgi:hypothetical protein